MNARKNKLALVFPGQGAFDLKSLREIYKSFPDSHPLFNEADSICLNYLGYGFLDLVRLDDAASESYFQTYPDLDQPGIFLISLFVAQKVSELGVKADLILGHSFGEISALTAAGTYSTKEGLEIVCKRVLSLSNAREAGLMAAISTNAEKLQTILDSFPHNSATISVVNGPQQTVVSGTKADLDDLSEKLPLSGMSVTLLKSRYPFHSTLLAESEKAFQARIRSTPISDANTPVYLTAAGEFYKQGTNLADYLSEQLTSPFLFNKTLEFLNQNDYDAFLEIGFGNIICRLVEKFNPESDLYLEPLCTKDESLTVRLAAVKQSIAKLNLSGAGATSAATPATPVPAAKTGNYDFGNQPIKYDETPVCIVGYGSILPGAKDSIEYWDNLSNGVGGIVDIGELDPVAKADFQVKSDKITPGKTYSLLSGHISHVDYRSDLLNNYVTQAEFENMTRAEKLLAIALGECLSKFPVSDAQLSKLQFSIGSTADGVQEHDEAVVLKELTSLAKDLPANVTENLEKSWGYSSEDAKKLSQNGLYERMLTKFFKKKKGDLDVHVVDTACSSSLYSIQYGMRALQNNETDLMLAGGVFAAGPANNVLFAQFGGLSRNGSRPLDSDADGVVFGDGSALVILKRLPDAIKDGDKIYGVIRGIGLSSDGKTPSVNVPRGPGQQVALKKAYANSRVPMDSIQYIEAHATSTSVGDSTEFNALAESFAEAGKGGRIPLGSSKALIGHTGWTSGSASIVKMLKSMEANTLPGQHNYVTPNENIDVKASPFEIFTSARPWPANANGIPRRAGINGFGFGGTNAHVILEEYSKDYHQSMVDLCETPKTPEKTILAITSVSATAPSDNNKYGEFKDILDLVQYDKPQLPRKILMLPDIVDSMDNSHLLSIILAEKILSKLPKAFLDNFREDVGVVLGLEGKVAGAFDVNNRVYLDKIKRIDRENNIKDVDGLVSDIEQHANPTGPYTLPGLMPNVAASRITHTFNFNGPNLVIDRDEFSLLQSLLNAEKLLKHGDCKLVLAGAIDNERKYSATPDYSKRNRNIESGVLFGLTTLETAKAEGLPILAQIELDSSAEYTSSDKLSTVEDGVLDMLRSLKGALITGNPTPYKGESFKTSKLPVFNAAAAVGTKAPAKPAATPAQKAPAAPSIQKIAQKVAPKKVAAKSTKRVSVPGFQSDTPIYWTAEQLVAADRAAGKAPILLGNKKILVLADQPELISDLKETAVDMDLNLTIVTPEQFAKVPEAERETHIGNFLKAIDFNVVMVLKDLKLTADDNLLVGDIDKELALLNLLFVTAKSLYEPIQKAEVGLYTLCLNAWGSKDVLKPESGLFSGFIKSLKRELPESYCIAVNFDESNLAKVLSKMELEIDDARNESELFFHGESRLRSVLKSLNAPAVNNKAPLKAESVVLATGAGRGVTAVLAEQMLREVGCKIIAVGRTDISGVPQHILDMSDEAFKAYETEFYRTEAKKPGNNIIALRKTYHHYGACREIHGNVVSFNKLPGSFEYHSLDITNPAEIDKLMADIQKKFGRLDMVIHGAGIQISKAVTGKSVGQFDSVVGAKLRSLNYIYSSWRKLQPGSTPDYHLLTSSFSYMGNDGQPDYGAANRAMDRMADFMNAASPDATWSSLAWLGWAAIGMTRDSGYLEIARQRSLRGITHPEGQVIFSQFLKGELESPSNILLANGEIDFYNIPLLGDTDAKMYDVLNLEAGDIGSGGAKQDSVPENFIVEKTISLENAPYIEGHVVNDAPTLPGAFMLTLVADACRTYRPDLKLTSFQNSDFALFAKIPEGGPLDLNIKGEIVEYSDSHIMATVGIYSDFVHKNGTVLQKDRKHFETTVLLVPDLETRKDEPAQSVTGTLVPDPYLLTPAGLKLSAEYECLSNIQVGESEISADFSWPAAFHPNCELAGLREATLLVDAFWRFGTMALPENGQMSVFVPRKAGDMRVQFDYAISEMSRQHGAVRFVGQSPRRDGNDLHVNQLRAINEKGETILILEQGLCSYYGEAPIEASFGQNSRNKLNGKH